MDIQHLSGAAAAVVQAPAREPREAAVRPIDALPIEAAEPEPEPQQLRAAVKEIQEKVGNSTTQLQFTVDEDTGRTIVSVIDAETRQVVRQIPAEEVMRMARAIDRLQGLLVNQQA